MSLNEKKIKKYIFIFAIILIACIMMIPISKYADENDIQISSYPTNDEGDFTVEINGKNNLKDVRLYKKVGNKYILFYTSSNINLSKKIYKIPKSKLSTTAETDIKVDAIDVNGNRKEVDVKAPIVPKYTPALSKTPTPSAKPTTNPTPSTSPKPTQGSSQQKTQNITISVDKSVLMLDNRRYKYSKLNATVTPSNAKVRYSSSNENVAKVNSKTGFITATGYGTTKITATATLGNKTKTAKCSIRVIAAMTEKTSDSGLFKLYKRELGGWQNYYIRNYSPTQKKVTKNAGWSSEEVESYINNAEWLLKTYPDKYSESAKCTYYYYPTDNANYPYTATKKKGAIAPNEWLLFFSSKNQWLYLLKKNSKGVWKINDSMRSSGGYYWGGFNKHIGRIGYNYGGTVFAMYKNPNEKGILNRNALHLSTLTPGYPTSGGCIHLGTSSNSLYRKLTQIAKTQRKTVKIIYF